MTEETLAGGVDNVGAVVRVKAFAEVHGLRGDQRRQVIDMLGEFLDQDGHPGFARLWADGYEAMNRRSRTWQAHQATGRLSTP